MAPRATSDRVFEEARFRAGRTGAGDQIDRRVRPIATCARPSGRGRVIPFFDMRAELASVRAELDAAIARVLDSGVFIGGPEVAAFEAALAAKLGVAHAIGVSSGTDA